MKIYNYNYSFIFSISMEVGLSVIKFLQLESDKYIEESRKFMEVKVKEVIDYTYKNEIPIYFESIYYIKIIPHINFKLFKTNLQDKVPDLEIKIDVYNYSFYIFYKRIRIGEILNIFYPFSVNNNNILNLSKIKQKDELNDIKYYDMHPKYILCSLLRELYSPANHDDQDEIFEDVLTNIELWKNDGTFKLRNYRDIDFNTSDFKKYVDMIKETTNTALFGIVDNVLYVALYDITPTIELLNANGFTNYSFNNGKIYEDIRLNTAIFQIPDSKNKIRLFNSLEYELIPAYKNSTNLHLLVLLRYTLVEYNILDISNIRQAADMKLNTFITKYKKVFKNINYDNCDFYGVYYPDTQYRKTMYLENIVKQRLSNIH